MHRSEQQKPDGLGDLETVTAPGSIGGPSRLDRDPIQGNGSSGAKP